MCLLSNSSPFLFKGCDVYAYDHTLDSPILTTAPNLRIVTEGIAAVDNDFRSLRTLDSFVTINKHSGITIDYLKARKEKLLP